MLSDTMMLGGGRKAAYSIENSLLFRGGQYLSRTPSAPGNQTLWTYSTWVRWTGSPQTFGQLLSAGYTVGTGFFFCHALDGTFVVTETRSPSDTINLRTSKVFRDPTAWLHVVLVYDSVNGTASERVRLYINGARVDFDYGNPYALFPNKDFPAYPNGTCQHWIGCFPGDASRCLMEYVAEPVFVDNAALTPSAFGDTDPVTGSWRPKALNVSAWGINGFYLGKSWNDASLGTDYSGKGNHWTPSGFVASDVLKDSPTNVYATLNPLHVTYPSPLLALSDGNLKVTQTANNDASLITKMIAFGTLGVSSGKWYYEYTVGSSPNMYCGYAAGMNSGAYPGGMPTYSVGYGSVADPAGTVWGYLLDVDNLTFTSYRNNVQQSSSGIQVGQTWFPCYFPSTRDYNGNGTFNFGQRSFVYQIAGAKSLCTANLPTPVSAAAKRPGKYYSCQTVVHNGSGTAVTLGWDALAADWLVRIKSLGSGDWHYIDTKRGLDKVLIGNSAQAEITNAAMVTNRTASGFVLGSGLAAATYLVEAWRVAPEAGFDIQLYSGTGSAKAVNHNNGTAPGFCVGFNRTNDGGIVYHKSLGATKYLVMNTAQSVFSDAAGWNNTEPTTTVVTVGNTFQISQSGASHVLYVWSEVPGFSKFGSYSGNNSADGSFIHLGFTAGDVTTKRTDAAGNWYCDTTDQNNPAYPMLLEASNARPADGAVDICASGVKLRNADPSQNVGTMIYAAWAAHPLGAERVTPATAR